MFKCIYTSNSDFNPQDELSKLGVENYHNFKPVFRQYPLIRDLPTFSLAHQELDFDIQTLEFIISNFQDEQFLICKKEFQVLEQFNLQSAIQLLPMDWDVFYLGGLNQVFSPLKIAEGLVRVKFALNNHFYLIKRNYLQVVLNKLKLRSYQSDLTFAKLQEKNNAYWISTIRNFVIPTNKENVISSIEPELFKQITLNTKLSQNNTLITKLNFDEKRLIKKSFEKDTDFGINVFGYLNDTIGISRSTRNLINLLKLSEVKLNTYDLKPDNYVYIEPNYKTTYPINLFFANPDWMIDVNIDIFEDKYNIGYWYWELEQIPELWKKFAKHLDEIWVSTTFIKTTLEKELPGKTIRLITKPQQEVNLIEKSIARTKFDFIQQDDFIFLFVFDYNSDINRKNVINLLLTFNRFNQGKNCKLILKCQNSHLKERNEDRLKVESFASNHVIIINDLYSESHLNNLYNSCDVYISLHRSEGFGLTILESIFRNIPVIATAYSGNMDFCDGIEPLLINYNMTEVNTGSIYHDNINGEKFLWAEPDLQDALNKMNWVYENYNNSIDLVKACKEKILSKWSQENCLKNIYPILQELENKTKPEISNIIYS